MRVVAGKRVPANEREDRNMRVMDVFGFGKTAFNPDPGHHHDKDRVRGWWGWDEQHHWRHWRWDDRRRCWY